MIEMKNKIQNIFKIIIIFFIILNIFIPKCKASFWSEIFDGGKEFVNTGKNAIEGSDSDNYIDTKEVKNQLDKIYNILFSLGVALTVIIGAILGIKFMIGSVEEQAKIKDSLFPYLVGCIVIYGSFGIWKLIIEILSVI